MVSVLTRSKKPKYLILWVLITVLLLSGCDPRAGRYPFQKAEHWYSEDPQMALSYVKAEDGTGDIAHQLVWENKEIPISIGMQSDYFCVYPANTTHHDDRLFSGRWHYRWGNLVLVLEEDFIFDRKVSKIVLSPMEAEHP